MSTPKADAKLTSPISLPPGNYVIYQSVLNSDPPSFNSNAITAPSVSGQPFSVAPYSDANALQKYLITGDGAIMSLGTGNYFASPNESFDSVQSASFTNGSKFAISITYTYNDSSTAVPGHTDKTTGWAGTIMSGDGQSQYLGTNIANQVSLSGNKTLWAFVPL